MAKKHTKDIYALPKAVKDGRNIPLYLKTYENLESHIKCNFTHFYVDNFGDFHNDAIRALQMLKHKYPHIHIHLVLVRDFNTCISNEIYDSPLYQGVELYSFKEKDSSRKELYADIEHSLISIVGGSYRTKGEYTHIFSIRSKAYLKTLLTKKVG